MKRLMRLGAIITLALVISGCSNKTIGQKVGDQIVKNTIETQTGAKVDVNSNGENVTIKTPIRIKSQNQK